MGPSFDALGVPGGESRAVLIIEDDPRFAAILLSMARDKDFKGLVASTGEAGLKLARQYKPDAITLDIKLPDMEGWAVLDQLKADPELTCRSTSYRWLMKNSVV